MASVTIDSINWLLPPTLYRAVLTDRYLHCTNRHIIWRESNPQPSICEDTALHMRPFNVFFICTNLANSICAFGINAPRWVTRSTWLPNKYDKYLDSSLNRWKIINKTRTNLIYKFIFTIFYYCVFQFHALSSPTFLSKPFSHLIDLLSSNRIVIQP